MLSHLPPQLGTTFCILKNWWHYPHLPKQEGSFFSLTQLRKASQGTLCYISCASKKWRGGSRYILNVYLKTLIHVLHFTFMKIIVHKLNVILKNWVYKKIPPIIYIGARRNVKISISILNTIISTSKNINAFFFIIETDK